MMQPKMSLEKAREIARVITYGRVKFGPQFQPPVSPSEINEALQVVAENANFDAPTREELTKANRQLAAAAARYERLKKQKGCSESTDQEPTA